MYYRMVYIPNSNCRHTAATIYVADFQKLTVFRLIEAPNFCFGQILVGMPEVNN